MNKKTITINGVKIEYWHHHSEEMDTSLLEMTENSIEHISKMIKEGSQEGMLLDTVVNSEEIEVVASGWWKQTFHEERAPGLTVKIDLYGNGEQEDMWEGIIYGLTKKEICDLNEKYDEEFEEEQFTGQWEDYLKEKQVKFEKHSFDVEIL
ncbi:MULTISPECIES: hypothetical protein [unclassified Psychrobacillus]|uniref:hypothetical protein n=1 Tax=unclassified Psychrobacillus TaxID=2636677 RepID=UPI0030F56C0E